MTEQELHEEQLQLMIGKYIFDKHIAGKEALDYYLRNFTEVASPTPCQCTSVEEEAGPYETVEIEMPLLSIDNCTVLYKPHSLTCIIRVLSYTNHSKIYSQIDFAIPLKYKESISFEMLENKEGNIRSNGFDNNFIINLVETKVVLEDDEFLVRLQCQNINDEK